MRPEHKGRLIALADRLDVASRRQHRPGLDRAERASDSWIGSIGPRIRGRVLEVGASGHARRFGVPESVDVIDPWGRGPDCRFVGELSGGLLPVGAYDLALATLVLDVDDDPASDVAALVSSVRSGGSVFVTAPAPAWDKERVAALVGDRALDVTTGVLSADRAERDVVGAWMIIEKIA